MDKNQNFQKRGRFPVETQVKGLFLDYDGTISPLNIARSESAVPPKTMGVLYSISQRIPVAIITTKDLGFVVERTPFAHAWSALGGLEMKVGDVTIRAPCLTEITPDLTSALNFAKINADNNIEIEEKHDSEGAVVAFSVDWRQAQNNSAAETLASKIFSHCETLPLTVIRYEGQPFFDVFPCLIDKGQALQDMKRNLGLLDGVLFMGDSAVDNPAFQEADFAVGVNGNSHGDLACDFFVEFDEVAAFLDNLLKNNFCLDLSSYSHSR